MTTPNGTFRVGLRVVDTRVPIFRAGSGGRHRLAGHCAMEGVIDSRSNVAGVWVVRLDDGARIVFSSESDLRAEEGR